jgi:hypothetical protein
MLSYYLAEGIKHTIKEAEHFPFGDLCDIVHAFAGIVADLLILVTEAGQNGRYNDIKIASDRLHLKHTLEC